ncbi:MAG: hypothetical protein Q9217_004640 [Psora testacea]
MGFDQPRAELALKKSGNMQDAIDWMEKNQEKSMEDILASEAEKAETDPNTEAAALKAGEEAKSLLCNDCGRKLRSVAQAEFHASKTGHENFSESTEEIAPLTEDEKKAKLEELRRKLAEKRAGTSEQDKLDKKRNEEIRRKSTKDTQDIKENLKKKEQLKEGNGAAAKKKEKQDEIAAKQRIKEKIAADKEERRLKAEREKAERAGQTPLPVPPAVPLSSSGGASKPASSYTDTRLRLQTSVSTMTRSFSVDATLFEVAEVIKQETGEKVSLEHLVA